MGYIYKITNKINQKCYIGKTERDPIIRWNEHCRHAKNGKIDIPLYRAINKYGITNFNFEIIEECNNDNLDIAEIFWITKYNSYQDGYNCTGGGEGGIKDYHEDLEEIIQRYQAGERLDLLCKEYHHDYASIRPKIEARGIKINTQAGPDKLSKKIVAINPDTQEIIQVYNSISEAGRALCASGKNPKAIANHISRYKNTNTISHGFLWKTMDKLGE